MEGGCRDIVLSFFARARGATATDKSWQCSRGVVFALVGVGLGREMTRCDET